MLDKDEERLKKEAKKLKGFPKDAKDLAGRLGLEPYETNYWMVDYDRMNELAAYGGFPKRYHHWRWGMKYDSQKKRSDHGLGKIYELVVNDNPSHAFLQESNGPADQKLVVTHVEGHSDFFKNNQWYKKSGEPNAADMLSRHADRIDEYLRDPKIDNEELEEFIDAVLCVEDLINQHKPYHEVYQEMEEEEDSDMEEDQMEQFRESIENLDLEDHLKEDLYDKIEDEEGEEPDKDQKEWRDFLAYAQKNGKTYNEETGQAEDMEEWQKDIIGILRKEAYYFAPQQMTKIMNEGWATYWHTKMMSDVGMADIDEIVDYADSTSGVVSDNGDQLNPYSLGLELWEYVENKANRREVIKHLLEVEGITKDNLYDKVDFEEVYDHLQPREELLQAGFENLEDLESIEEKYIDQENLERAKKIKSLLEDENTISEITDRTIEVLEESQEEDPEQLKSRLFDGLEDYLDQELQEEIFRKLVTTYLTEEEDLDIDDPIQDFEGEDIFTKMLGSNGHTKEIIEAYTDTEQYKIKNLVKSSIRGSLDIDRYPWKLLTFEGTAEKYYSLAEEGNDFLEKKNLDEVEDIARIHVEDDSKYNDIEEALSEVDKTKGWRKMRENMEIKNDVMFIDEYITQEFVDQNGYYTSENIPTEKGHMPVVTSVDAEDVKKKLALKLINGGKPTVKVQDGNYKNRKALLLAHDYNGIPLDIGQAMQVLDRSMPLLWGRETYLKTIVQDWDIEQTTEVAQEAEKDMRFGMEPDLEGKLPRPEEQGLMLGHDGKEILEPQELSDEEVEDIKAEEVDYNTIPEELFEN